MQMPPEMLAAIKAHFADEARGWHLVAAMVEQHHETVVADVEGIPTATDIVHRSASITARSDVMGGRTIVFMIEGGADTWDSGRAIFSGVSFDFDDEPLLTGLGNRMAALGPVAAAAIMDGYFGSIPPAEED